MSIGEEIVIEVDDFTITLETGQTFRVVDEDDVVVAQLAYTDGILEIKGGLHINEGAEEDGL